MVRVAHHDTRIPEHAVFGILAMCLLAATAPADEAVRRDGSRTNGELVFTDSKKFDFKGIPFAELEIVRFKPKASSTPHTPLWHQVWLARGEVMFAEVRRLDANQLHVRPSWSGDVIAIPRTAIERITHRPGWQPVLFDSFERDLSLWKTNGEPRIDNGKLILDKPGQSIAATVDSQWNAGQIVVGAEFSQTKSRLVHLELVFLRNGKDSRIQIELAGPDKRFKLSSDRKPKLEQAIARASQSALVVEFNLDRLDVAVDDKVLWVEDESPGTLKSVRLVSSGDGGEASSVNDILVARQVAKSEPRAWADLTADAIRSPDGDETFGSLVDFSSHGVTLETRGRKQSQRWNEVAEWTFRRGVVEEKATTGEQVQARIVNANRGVDILEGAVLAFNDKSLWLMHPVLGKITIPRERLAELRFLFHGRRVPVDSMPRHLGAKPTFGFAVAKPEGLSFKKSVRVESAATGGFVVVDAAHVSGKGEPIEVLVDGKSLGELNRQADRADAVVRSYRLPMQAIAVGDVEIEIRVQPSKDGRRINGIDLRAVRLELHDRR